MAWGRTGGRFEVARASLWPLCMGLRCGHSTASESTAPLAVPQGPRRAYSPRSAVRAAQELCSPASECPQGAGVSPPCVCACVCLPSRPAGTDHGQLGLGHAAIHAKVQPHPMLVAALRDTTVTMVAAGGAHPSPSHSLQPSCNRAATLWNPGCSPLRCSPLRISLQPAACSLQPAACSPMALTVLPGAHSLAIGGGGEVYAFGKNAHPHGYTLRCTFSLGSARARQLLLRARRAALGRSNSLGEERLGHWAPQPLPRVLEPAASKGADSTVSGHTGARPAWCYNRCMACAVARRHRYAPPTGSPCGIAGSDAGRRSVLTAAVVVDFRGAAVTALRGLLTGVVHAFAREGRVTRRAPSRLRRRRWLASLLRVQPP